MAARRAIRTPMRRFKKRRAPLRTTGVRETKWSTSRWTHTQEFAFDFEAVLDVDLVIMNPRIFFEMTLQPSTPVGGPVTNIGPIINQLQATRGVKVGGLVFQSGFHVARPVRDNDEDLYVNAYTKCVETIWTRETDPDGIPQDAANMDSVWRPLRNDDSVFDPNENAGDLVRIHHTRGSILAAGSNAFGFIPETFPQDFQTVGAASAAASTWTQPGWGGTRSLRLRKFITDEQTLNWNLRVSNPVPSAGEQLTVVWQCFMTVYWATQNQR